LGAGGQTIEYRRRRRIGIERLANAWIVFALEALLDLASRVAAIAAAQVAIITSLRCFDSTISAHWSDGALAPFAGLVFEATRGGTAVPAHRVPVVAELALGPIRSAIAAIRGGAGHE
jgi:hypothetical protein